MITLLPQVDLVEGEELERDIRIIETHWINVFELLNAAFAVVAAREEADHSSTESEEDTTSLVESLKRRIKGGFALDIQYKVRVGCVDYLSVYFQSHT